MVPCNHPFFRRERSCWLFLMLMLGSSGFNLDPRIAVIKTAGIEGGYFGYSVAQHRTMKSTSGEGESVILVGAPKDNNLQPGTERSGALWRCSLTSSTNDCQQVETDGKRLDHRNGSYGEYDGNLEFLNPPITSELKDGQWLGVEVKSQGEGGKVVVCAHRYTVRDVTADGHKVKDSKRGMLGMCYILDSNLTLPKNKMVSYKNLVSVRGAVGGKRLKTKKAFHDHAQWGVCQVGTSASFVDDRDALDENDSDLVLFGAPGCFTWRGNVFGQHLGSFRPSEKAVNANSFRDFNKHGLLGMAVTSGRFFNNQVFYASGAPHAGNSWGTDRTGRVYFFRTHPDSGARFHRARDHTLKGEQFGAGFGYALEKLDSNGDGSPDLLVGAPFYDGGGGGGSGAVYLYLSKSKSLSQQHCVKIIGKEQESRFGLSLSSAGDLNKDGYEDFAVGAPYQTDGQGAVYIFFGGPKGIRSHGPSERFHHADEVADQIVKASDIAGNADQVLPFPFSLKTFGNSLSGGMDMDGNGYPDLLVGAHESSHAILLRARPIIDVTTFVDDTNLKAIDPGKAGCPDDTNASDPCFGFRACFRVVHDEERTAGLDIRYVVEAEPKKPVSRVWLRLKTNGQEIGGGGGNNKSSVVEGTLVIQRGDGDHCKDVLGYLGSSHADLQTPVEFSLSYSLVQAEPTMRYADDFPLPVINNFPILNQAQAKKKFQATFEKDCGEDDICQANIHIRPKLTERDGTELSKTAAGSGDFYQLQLGSLKNSELVLDVTVSNTMEAAYEAVLEIDFPASVDYVGIGQNARMGTPRLVNATRLSVSIGNPFRKESARLQLRFSPKRDTNASVIVFFLSVNSSSPLIYDPSTFSSLVVVRKAEVKVVGRAAPVQVHYGGKELVVGESAVVYLAKVGPQIIHKFLVVNSGPSMVDVLNVRIRWPFQVENEREQGKWLLYLTDHPTLKNGRGFCTLPAQHKPNPLNLTAPSSHDGNTARRTAAAEAYSAERSTLRSEKNVRRNRREAERVIKPKIFKRPPDDDGIQGEKRVVTLDCDLGTAKCFTITCSLYKVPAKLAATIEVRSRLWNSSLAEDYNDVDEVEIYSKASIFVDKDVIQDRIDDDFASVLTLAFPDSRKRSVERGPDWWVILLSVLIGLLLLVLISLILWKLGFFQRTRPDDDDVLMSAHFERAKLNGSFADS